MTACPFCEIAAGRAPATVIREWPDALAILPRGGVTEGHTLVIPRRHVADATENPAVTGATMTRAAELAAEVGADLNLITSVGPAATQTVFHLHLHLVPRRAGDGLALPWTRQQAAA
ncbi:HIT family protein [Streptomyces albus]|uniref:HIT family protein n=1 Tax=Streptomyces sp. NRRL F-5917 TaxID=1463873 RepID=UPI000D141DE7|nr:HIT family protein [Streptomyces sp. NRRL F-5917]